MSLFVRSGRSVQLTSNGEQFLQSVRSALDLLDGASRDLFSQTRGSPGQIRISALPFLSTAVLIPALGDLERCCPGVVIRLEGTHQYAGFNDSGIDVAVRYGRERSEGLRLEPLISVTGMPVCSPALAHDLASPSDISRHVLIQLSQQPRAWSAWLRDMAPDAPKPRGELWLDSVPGALEAAEQGLGVALAMDPLIKGWRGWGDRLVASFDLKSKRAETLYFVCRPQSANDRHVQTVRLWLHDALAKLCNEGQL